MHTRPSDNFNSEYCDIISAAQSIDIPETSSDIWNRIEQTLLEQKEQEPVTRLWQWIMPARPRMAVVMASVMLLVTISSLTIYRENVMYNDANNYLNNLVSYTYSGKQLIDDELILLGTF